MEGGKSLEARNVCVGRFTTLMGKKFGGSFGDLSWD
jgi:hypothetical protein